MKVSEKYKGEMVTSVFQLKSGMYCNYRYYLKKDYEEFSPSQEERYLERGDRKVAVYPDVNEDFCDRLQQILQDLRKMPDVNEKELSNLLEIGSG